MFPTTTRRHATADVMPRAAWGGVRAAGSARESLTACPPLPPERARCRAHGCPGGPVAAGRAEAPWPTERCTSLHGPSSVFLSPSVRVLCARLALTDLHPVLAMTARRWATTPPPSSSPYAGMVASHSCGHTALECPGFAIRDVRAAHSCLLDAERIRDSPGGGKDPTCPPPSRCGPGVSATDTCLGVPLTPLATHRARCERSLLSCKSAPSL